MSILFYDCEKDGGCECSNTPCACEQTDLCVDTLDSYTVIGSISNGEFPHCATPPFPYNTFPICRSFAPFPPSLGVFNRDTSCTGEIYSIPGYTPVLITPPSDCCWICFYLGGSAKLYPTGGVWGITASYTFPLTYISIWRNSSPSPYGTYNGYSICGCTPPSPITVV